MARATATADPQRAVAYLRVSLDQQADSGLGLEAQRHSIQRWALARSVEVVAWTEDAGVSGAAQLEKRLGLMAAMGALRQHGAGLLVVAKRDRVARDVILAAMAERLVEREGARLVSAAGEGEGTDPAAQLMRRMVDAFAEYERALIRARTSSALQAKMARGERLGGARVGERLVGGKYEPDELEAALVARVMELRQQGLSYRSIRAQLAAEGFQSRGGKAPRLATIFALTHRPLRGFLAAPPRWGERPDAASAADAGGAPPWGEERPDAASAASADCAPSRGKERPDDAHAADAGGAAPREAADAEPPARRQRK